MYALNLSEEYRILSVCEVLPDGIYDGMPIVETLPDGDVSNYLYKDGGYIYDPIPVEEFVYEPSAEELLNALLGVTSHE